MALAYKWTINQLDAKIHSEGHDNVIYTIHYTYTGIDEKLFFTFDNQPPVE